MEVRGSSSEILGSSEHAPKRGMVLPFRPLSLAFNHVNYYVDMPAVSYSCQYENIKNFIFFLKFNCWLALIYFNFFNLRQRYIGSDIPGNEE